MPTLCSSLSPTAPMIVLMSTWCWPRMPKVRGFYWFGQIGFFCLTNRAAHAGFPTANKRCQTVENADGKRIHCTRRILRGSVILLFLTVIGQGIATGDCQHD